MTLYEIDEAIESCWFQATDRETGEIKLEALDTDMLDHLEMERDQKIENVGKWVKSLVAEQTALEKEASALKARAALNEKKIESLKKWLAIALNGKKGKFGTVSISFRSSESTVIDDESKIPDAFMNIKTVKSPNKTAIKEAICSGARIEGAHIQQNLSTIIK